MENKSEILKEIEIEDYIWIVYLGLIIFSFWSNNEERKYIIFGDISAKENYRKSLVLVFSIASIIYFYFFILVIVHIKIWIRMILRVKSTLQLLI